MSALATMPIRAVVSPIDAPAASTAQLMRELLQLRNTTRPAPSHMLDALYLRGMGRLADVLAARNVRLSVDLQSAR